MADQLTPSQIDELVNQQLRRMQNEYQQVHKYDMNHGISKKQQSNQEQEIDYIQFDQEDLMEEPDHPDSDSGSEQQEAKKDQIQVQEKFNQNYFKPSQAFDVDKIKSIALAMNIQSPQWANDESEWKIRLKAMLKNSHQ